MNIIDILPNQWEIKINKKLFGIAYKDDGIIYIREDCLVDYFLNDKGEWIFSNGYDNKAHGFKNMEEVTKAIDKNLTK
jgi:hypothetical protein